MRRRELNARFEAGIFDNDYQDEWYWALTEC